MASVNDATFSQVLSAPLAIVEFWNERCPNCTRFKPIYEDVSSQMAGKILMVTANTDESQKSAGSYGITGVPTTIFFMNGKEVHRVVGAMSKEDFLNEISKGLSLSEAAAAAEAPEGVGDVLVGGAVLAGLVVAMGYLVPQIA
jgi:thioredoxin 1